MVIAEPKPKPKITEWQVQKPSDLIREKGWCQGSWEFNGRYCLVGAIYSIFKVSDPKFGKFRMELLALVEYEVDKIGGDLAPEGWNDEEGRTQQEVMDLLIDVEQEFENLCPDIIKP